MIYKSYQVEQNISLIKNNLVLFYGENLGLKNDFKLKICQKSKAKIIKLTQSEILIDKDNFHNEVNNLSLFNDKKIFIISDVNDKIVPIIEDTSLNFEDNKFFLFAEILDKKSLLRKFFEKNNMVDIVPCYPDGDLEIKKLISQFLNNYSGITQEVLNLITDNCGNDRIKLTNELNKISSFFIEKKIDLENLKGLLNLKTNDDFNKLRDLVISGNKVKANKYLTSTIMENDKIIFYLMLINQRLNKLKQISLKGTKNINQAINELKPPVFWKDKPNILQQAKLWDKYKIDKYLNKTYEIEKNIKSNSMINKEIIFKRLLLDICNGANAS